MCQGKWKAPCSSGNPSLECISRHSRLHFACKALKTSKHKKLSGGGFLLESPDQISSSGFVLKFATRWEQRWRCHCCVFISFLTHPSVSSWPLKVPCSLSCSVIPWFTSCFCSLLHSPLKRKITQQGELLLLLYSKDVILYERFSIAVLISFGYLQVTWMQTVFAFVLKSNPWGKHPSSSREAFGGTRQPACQPKPILQDLRICFPSWIPLPWALCCCRGVFVQTAGWGRLSESQRAEASPGYVSAASELEHVVCLMLQQSTSPGKVSLIQLHLERHIFPGVMSGLFQAEFDPVTVGVNPCGVWLF